MDILLDNGYSIAIGFTVFTTVVSTVCYVKVVVPFEKSLKEMGRKLY